MRAASRSFPAYLTSTLPKSARATLRGLRAKKARSSGRSAGNGGAMGRRMGKCALECSAAVCSAAVPAAVRRASSPAAPGARRAPGTAGKMPALLLCTLRPLGRAFRRFLQVSQHLSRMAFRFYFGKNMLDFAVGPDDERGPDDAHDFLAVHV